MIEKYTLENKPNFVDGEIVSVDMSCFGLPPQIRTGKVVGKSFEHIIDTWLVEFDSTFPSYPFKVAQVPHTFILVKTSEIKNEEEDIHAYCMEAAFGSHGQG
jgi:hypothetical protein